MRLSWCDLLLIVVKLSLYVKFLVCTKDINKVLSVWIYKHRVILIHILSLPLVSIAQKIVMAHFRVQSSSFLWSMTEITFQLSLRSIILLANLLLLSDFFRHFRIKPLLILKIEWWLYRRNKNWGIIILRNQRLWSFFDTCLQN